MRNLPSCAVFNVIANLFLLTLRLCLFRAEPQDMPYSLPITRGLAGLAVFSSTLLMGVMLPLPLAIAAGIGGVVAIYFFTQTLLRIRQKEPRLLQTLAAQYAVGSLFALALLPAFSTMAPFVMEVMKNPEALEKMRSGETPMPGSSWASLMADVLFFWNLVVSVRINRAAAELSTPVSWLLTLACLFVVMSFVTFSQLVVFPLVK